MSERRVSTRVLSFLLVLCMVIGMLPMNVLAADTTGNPAVSSNADTILAYAQGKLDDNHDKTGKYTWDTEEKEDGWRYFNGLMLEAFLRNGLKANETENALTFAQKYFDHNVKEGSSLSNAVPHMAQTELDGIPPARVLAQLVGHVGFTDAKYANAVELIYKNTIGQKQVSGTDGNFIHKENNSSWENWQIGLDGLYMAQPFLMETAKAIHENRLSIDGVTASSIADGVYARFNWVSTNMKFETEEGSGVWLYHHGWGPEGSYKNGNGVTWSRGVGWYAAGLADCIALMEDIGYDSGKVATLKGHLKTLLDGMLAYQDESGLWNNVVYVKGDGVPSSNNFLETSGTGLMAYTLMMAYTHNWLGSTYGQAGVKAIDGIMENNYSSGKFTHILKSSGVETSASGYNSEQSSDEAKGTGAIILAAAMYDDVVAGTSYAETYQIGLVNVTELDVVNGAVQTSGLKATVVGSKGTIKDVAAANLTTEVNGSNVDISYNGNKIATVKANIIDVSADVSDTGSIIVEQAVTDTPNAPAVTAGTWTTISAGGSGSGNQYTVVTAPTAGKSYLLNASGKTRTINWTGSGWAAGDITKDGPDGEGVYTITGTVCHWVWDADDYFYTVVGDKTYYLSYTGTSSANITATTTKADATVFTIAKTNDGVVSISGVVGGKTRYLNAASSNPEHKDAAQAMVLFEQVTAGESKYAALVGTATYAYAVTSSNTAEDVLALIQSDYKIQTSTAADGANPSNVAWNDSTVSYSWDTALDTTKEDTYTLTVKVDGKEIGKIPVLVYGATVEVPYDITLDCTGVSVEVGGKANLNPTLTIPDYNGNKVAVYEYVSADSKIATVTDNGEVSGVATGTTEITITLKSVDGVEVSGVSVTVPVAVIEKTCTHEYATSVTAPTCTAQGYTTYTCSKCGHSYEGDFVAALGHSFGAYTVTKAATCGAAGEQTADCSNCDAKDTKVIPATGEHSWQAGTAVAPTCTEAGYTPYTCSGCSATKTEAGDPATGHSYSDGVCENCGETEPGYVVPSIDNITAPDNTTGKATVTAGGTLTLTANFTGDVDIRWSSSNNEIATVENGVVTAKKAGTVTITATLVAKTRAIGDSATFEVTVYEASEDKTGAWKEIEYTTTGGETTGGTTTTTTTYELVTGTTFPGAGKYIIVYKDSATATTGYALMSPENTTAKSTGEAQAVTLNADGTVTVSANVSRVVWTFTANGELYNITNSGGGVARSLRQDSSVLNYVDNNSNDRKHGVVLKDSNTGAYQILLGNSDNRILTLAGSEWSRNGSSTSYVYLYKETTNTTGGTTTEGETVASKWAQLTSNDYTVTAGTMTNAEIEELVKSFIIQQSEKADHSDATAYQGDYTIGWDKTLDADTVGTYTATVSVPVTGHDTIESVDLGTITVNVVAATVCEHTNTEIRNQKDATCGEAGYTGDTYCSNCGNLISSGSEIAATGEHSYDDGVVTTQPSCTTEGVKTFTCSVCDHSYTEAIAKLAHTEEAIPAVDATCTTAGSTAGVKCSVCDEVITAPTTIPATGHTDANGDYECDACGTALQNPTDYIHDFTIGDFPADEEIFTATVNHGSTWDSNLAHSTLPALGYNSYYKLVATDSISFTAPSAGTLILKMKGRNADGYTNSVTVTDGANKATEFTAISKTELVEETVAITAGGTVTIAASNGQPVLYYIEFQPEEQCEHTNTQVIPAVPATCTATGLTEGKKCNDCGEILVEQTVTDKLDHQYENGECKWCGEAQAATKPTGEYKPVSTTTQGGTGETKYYDYNITSGEKYVVMRGIGNSNAYAVTGNAGGTTGTWSGDATNGWVSSIDLDVWTIQLVSGSTTNYYIIDENGQYLTVQTDSYDMTMGASAGANQTSEFVITGADGVFRITSVVAGNSRSNVVVNSSGKFRFESSARDTYMRQQVISGGTTTVTEYYAISDITAAYDQGTTENIADAIKGRIALWKATAADGTGAAQQETLPENLTVDTSAVNVGVPGTYNAIVKLGDVEIGTVPVTINEVEQEVTYTYEIHGTVADVTVGGTPNFGNITVTKTGSDNSAHTYEAKDLTFSTVDTTTAGEKTVTVTVDGQSFTLTFNVKESAGALTVIVHPDTLSVPRHGYEEILIEVLLGEQSLQPGDYTITWTSSNPDAATITQSQDNLHGGIVYGVEQGTTDITASVVYTDASGNVYNGSATTTTTTTTTTTSAVESDPVMVDSALSGGDRTYVKVDTIAELAALEDNQDVILVFNQGSHYAADITDSLGFDSQRLKPTLISGDTYSLATYSSSDTYANRWYITKGTAANSYYLSAKVGEKTYYLSHANDELALVETQSADCLWTARECNSSGVVAMSFYYLDTDGKYNQLQTTSSTMGIATDRSQISTSNERQAVVYVPNEVGGEAVYTYARVNGITSYVIQQGDTLTEAMILEKIKVQLESSSNPGVWEDLAWTDSRINYNWRGVNLDSNTAGRYAMAIRVNNQLVHRVFVTVEPAAYTIEISTADNASSVAMDSTLQATAVIKNSDGTVVPGTITWSSSSSALASVDANGLISGKINGDVTITASTVIGGRTYTATKKITVTSKVNYEKYIQNLTTEGFEDNLNFYTFGGNHNVGNADPITYNGSDLDTFMKMESSTDISFKADADGEFVVIAAQTSATVKLSDGTKDIEPTIVTEKGYTKYTFTGLTNGTTYHLKKDNSQALVAYWEFLPDGVAHETVSINIELEGDEDELVMGGTLTQGQAYAEVTIAGVMSTNEPVTWASEDPSIVSIDASGVYKAEGVGQTYITATYEHTYDDGTKDTYVDRYLIFVLDGNAITSAKLSQETITFNKDQAVTKESFMDADGNPITLTLINAKGEETTIKLTDERIGLGDLTSLTSVAGTKTVLVSYDGVAYLPINVRVVDADLDKHDGRVFQEVNVIYSLDIDGIDDGKEYVLVAVTEAPAEGSNTWKGVALLNPNDSTSNTKGTIMEVTGDLASRTITFTGTAAEIANAKEFGLWTFNRVSGDSYLIVNSNRNFRENSSYLTKADNDENDAVTVEAYTAEGAYYFNLGSSNWLSYYDGAWVRTKTSSADATVFLFEKISETATVGADLVSITAPDQDDIHVGNAFTSVPTVHVNDTPTTDYTIEWTSSDPAVATVDANGKISYLSDGTATITATLTHIGGEEVTVNEGKSLSMSFDVTVPLETTSLQITPDNIVVPLNGEVDLSEVRIVRVRQTIVNDEVTDTTYESLDSSLITFDLVGANNKQGVDTSVAGESYQVDTYYDGVKQGAVTVNIGHTVFDGRDTATSLPEYPAGGAVRADKTAVNAEGFSFLETGVSKVEITAAGVTTQSDIDVILVVDVSNSMAWSMDWFEGLSNTDVSDAKKIPDNGVDGIDKLDMAMTHASTFADILLEDGNNSLTFVTFAGCDTDNGGSNYDSVQTVFTGVTDASKAKTSFAGTRYTALSGSDGVTVTLQITDENGNSTKGTNRGNTNYDYGFGQAMSAIRDMKDQWEADTTKNPKGLTYEESGRQIHVVFMTDGAPSHYNGVRNGGSTSDTIYGTSTKYSNKSYADTDWTAYIQNPNTLATELYNTPGVTGFHTVGFDLAHGGFGSYTANAADMTYVLRGLVTSQDLDVVSAENEAQLQNFFESLAHSLTMAGREAYVTDIVGADYTLYMGTELLNDSNGEAIEGVPSEVNVKLYTLVTPSLIAKDSRFNASQIGQRVCDIEVDGQKIGEITSGENQNVTILEKITFTVDGTNITAHSSVKGDIAVVDGGFKASTFEYKVVDGKGNITWNIGDITHQEISLSYYAHLNGVADGGTLPANGTYFTNESAHITYIDANDDKAVQEFPKPAMAFGSASIRVRFVLVTEDGRYANNAGNAFGSDIHANRIYATEEYMMNVGLNTETNFTPEVLAQIVQQTGISAKYLPLVQSASFTIGNGSGEDGAAITKGLSGLTWSGAMATPWTDGNGHTHDLDTLLVVTDKTGDGSYSQAIVEIPVVSLGGETAQNRLFTASTVIDFGTPVDFEIGHELEIEAFKKEGYEMTLVGFAPYSDSFDQKLMIKPAQVSAGTKKDLATDGGVFSIKNATGEDGNPVITFTPTAPMGGVQKAFATIRFSIPEQQDTSYYYMYKEINIIPANIMYYEAEDIQNAISLGGTWNNAVANSTEIEHQTASPVGSQDTYGYDASYLDCSTYSGHQTLSVAGSGYSNTYLKFTFTGTGFDLISKTGPKEGTIRIIISKSGTKVKETTVINKGATELYQIPVYTIRDLDYGTYDVEIGVANAVMYPEGLEALNRGNSFYFDAIRIYNCANTSEVVTKTDAGATTTVQQVYAQAGEANAKIYELRDVLIGAATDLNANTNGAIYVDVEKEFDPETGAEIVKAVTMEDYKTVGPNNELYLPAGKAITFALTWSKDNAPASIDIAAKSVQAVSDKLNDPSAKMQVYIATDAAFADERFNAVAATSINTATVMYYPLVDAGFDYGNSETIYIHVKNNGTGILSITDLKIADGNSSSGTESVSLMSNANVLSFAEFCENLGEEDFEPETGVQSTITQKGRTLSYEDMIYVVDIFALNGVEGIDLGKDAGLLVWSADEFDANNIVFDEAHAIPGLCAYGDTGYYYGASEGIFTRDLHKEAYYVGYVKLADGTYAYSEARLYSPATYAYNMLGKADTDADTQALCIALLNYISAAQKYFHGTADADLVNANLTDEQKALTWNDPALNLAPEVPADKQVARDNKVFLGRGKNLLFEEMISMVAMFRMDSASVRNAEAYGTIFWTAEQFAALEGVPSVDNFGDGTPIDLSYYGADQWYSAAPAVAPKDMADTTYYILGYVIHEDGTVSYSGVMAYTFEQYINNMADSATMGEFAMRLYYYERAAKAALGAK